MSEEKNISAVDMKKNANKTPTATPTKSAAPASPPVNKSEKIIYLGPTLIDEAFVLTSNTIYSNGLPSDVTERIKSDTDLAKFFVPVGKAASVMNKLADSNSDLSATAKKVKTNYLSKRKKG